MLVFLMAIAALATSGCASHQRSRRQTQATDPDAHIRSLEKDLRRARGKIEYLRERNLVLGQKVRMLESDNATEPAPLEAFAEPMSTSPRAKNPAQDLIDIAKPVRKTAGDYIDLRHSEKKPIAKPSAKKKPPAPLSSSR